MVKTGGPSAEIFPDKCNRCGEMPNRLVPIFILNKNRVDYEMRAFCTGCAMLELGVVDQPTEEESKKDET